MKLAGVQATRYFAKPEAHRTGLLIFGMDAMRVAIKRQEVIAALIGPEGEFVKAWGSTTKPDARPITSAIDGLLTQ